MSFVNTIPIVSVGKWVRFLRQYLGKEELSCEADWRFPTGYRKIFYMNRKVIYF